MIQSLFGKVESRGLMIGLDASGRTTFLYKLKLGEVVTTIPTIGFNVETIDYKLHLFTLWDVGGCDKIRPLWRHYFANTQFCLFFIDSNDKQRISESREELHRMLNEDELRNCLFIVLANKQDLPNAMSPQEVSEKLGLFEIRRTIPIQVFPICAISGDGLYEVMDAVILGLGNPCHVDPIHNSVTKKTEIDSKIIVKSPQDIENDKIESILIDWLQRDDKSDEIFLYELEHALLENWDHYTHLRIAWLYLIKYDRREGLPKIFASIKSFIERSPLTKRKDISRGTTFHETMTYFWTHMVHYAIVATANPNNTFKAFLLMNPQLANGGLFLHYYSKNRMLLNAEARSTVLLPDIRPLPSLISTSVLSKSITGIHESIQPKAPQTDQEFFQSYLDNSLSSYGHDTKIRLIYIYLTSTEDSPSNHTEGILKILSSIEKTYFHMTLAYFWMNMVRFCIAVATKDSKSIADSTAAASSKLINFDTFYRLPTSQSLRNDNLYAKYYSKRVLALSEASQGFVLPDLKQLPNKV